MRNERVTHNRVVQLLVEQLNYTYLGNLHDQENSNIRDEDVKAWLYKTGYTEAVIGKALLDFKRTAALNPSDDLYPVNRDVYHKLRYGVKIKDNISDLVQTVWLIDWKNPQLNHFAVAEEVTVKGENTKRPDIVLYVNGIALSVLELKSSSVYVTKAIRQNLDNQQHRFIKPFFSTIQTVLAGNDSQGLFYGTTKTSEKFFLKSCDE
jgi:type I restriction enzyme R subunit